MTASPSHLLAALALAASLAVAAPLGAQALGPADGAGLAPTDTGRVRAGMVAPDFTLESFAGPRITLSQFRGQKVVLLAFYRGHW
jgi:cytochrome oxidase Cu insertion factor (SCO1/SenC/PrrC family)